MTVKAGRTLNLPPLPPTQALCSDTFRPPPLDGSLSIPELYDWHYEHSPQHPLFVYSDEHGVTTTIRWAQAVRAIHKAGRIVLDLAQGSSAPKSARPIFAILANNDAVTYFTLMAGICRAGFVAYAISPRNSPAAVAHLLSNTGVVHVLVGSETQDLADASLQIMRESGTVPPDQSRLPTFEDLYFVNLDSEFDPLPPLRYDWNDPLVILHSSGSTAFPKPIVWTHERLLLCCLAPWFGERDLTGQRLAFHSMPMYHGLGLMQIGWTACCGLILTVFKPQIPPLIPTPDSVMKGALDTRSDFIFCVPSFIETWAENPEHVRRLREIQGVIYGGGPLSQNIGDELTAQGISVFLMYGNSECGINNMVLPRTVGKDWQYFTFGANIKPYFITDSDNNAELVLLSNQFQKPCIINTTVHEIPGYATSDLLSPHPSKPGYWKIFGRTDDQIMHNTGEKTNPGPLEKILNQDPHVQSSIVFGRGRFNAGVLVDPRPKFKFDPVDQENLADFRNKIWPTIEKLNQFAPQHSRIFKEMILVSSPSKPFSYTVKHTARRQVIIDAYEPEIEALYEAVELTAQTELNPPATWEYDDVILFVREVLQKVLKHPIGDHDDFFLAGCDSLQVTWIRNSLLHAIRETTSVNARAVSNNFIYQYPSIASLASFLVHMTTCPTKTVLVDKHSAILAMKLMVEKYSLQFPTHKPCENPTSVHHDTLVITGTTGSLGAALLAELMVAPNVAHIYAINRKSQKPLLERQMEAFQRMGLANAVIQPSTNVTFIEANLEEENLDLEPEILHKIRKSATHIIHNAWPVNFNLSLQFFDQNVRSLRNLIDLALSSHHASPPRLIFISSVGVLRHACPSLPVKEGPVDPEIAVGSGYSESKWVAEKLLDEAASRSALRPLVVRAGQLSGSRSGAWKETEWFPSLIQSSVYLKCFPAVSKEISWLPTEDAARAVVEMKDAQDVRYLHLAHPHPVDWSTIANPIATELDLPLVPYTEWLSMLTKSGKGLESKLEQEVVKVNSALKLLDFFTQISLEPDSREMAIPGLDLSQARSNSSALDELKPLSADIVLKWISYWRHSGFLPSDSAVLS